MWGTRQMEVKEVAGTKVQEGFQQIEGTEDCAPVHTVLILLLSVQRPV